MREAYITFRQAMSIRSTNSDVEKYIRLPIAQRIKDKGENPQALTQTPPTRHYAFFHHWAWWRNRWWMPDQRQRYQTTMHLRLENRLKAPAYAAGAFLGYLNPQSSLMTGGVAEKNYLQTLQTEALREIDKQLNLWFWQRWWGIGMPQANPQSVNGYWLQLRSILALPLDDLKGYEAAFLRQSQAHFRGSNPMPAPQRELSGLEAAPRPATAPEAALTHRVGAGSVPAAPSTRPTEPSESKEAELRLEDWWSKDRQDKIVDRLRRGETLPREGSFLAELYGIDLMALLGKGASHEAAILEQIKRQKRVLWRLAHPNSAADGTLREGPATQLRTWLADEAIQNLIRTVKLFLTSTIKPATGAGNWTAADEEHWVNYVYAPLVEAAIQAVEGQGQATDAFRDTNDRAAATVDAFRATNDTNRAILDRVGELITEARADGQKRRKELDEARDQIDDLYRSRGLPIPDRAAPRAAIPSIGERFVAGAAEETRTGAAATTDGTTLLPLASGHHRTP